MGWSDSKGKSTRANKQGEGSNRQAIETRSYHDTKRCVAHQTLVTKPDGGVEDCKPLAKKRLTTRYPETEENRNPNDGLIVHGNTQREKAA